LEITFAAIGSGCSAATVLDQIHSFLTRKTWIDGQNGGLEAVKISL